MHDRYTLCVHATRLQQSPHTTHTLHTCLLGVCIGIRNNGSKRLHCAVQGSRSGQRPRVPVTQGPGQGCGVDQVVGAQASLSSQDGAAVYALPTYLFGLGCEKDAGLCAALWDCWWQLMHAATPVYLSIVYVLANIAGMDVVQKHEQCGDHLMGQSQQCTQHTYATALLPVCHSLRRC